MLTDLTIKNLAIIDSLTVSFAAGLNILTGETGAGKSIIIDAVNLLLGSRGGSDLIRAGADEAAVEAIFDLSGQATLLGLLADKGIECDGELLVKRVIARSGKSRVFINGSMATLTLLAEISRHLVNIYGQHESQTLLRVENHLEMLDGYAGLKEVRNDFAQVHRAYRKLQDELRQLEEGERDALRRLDILTYQLDEIAAAGLITGEDEQLEQEKNLLSHAEKLLSRTESAYETLYGGERPLLGSLRSVETSVADAAKYDPSLQPLVESLSSVYLQLEDASLSLRDYAARIEADPARIQAVDDRLELIRRLKKKYGASIDEILACHKAMALELQQLQGREESRELLEERRGDLERELARLGKELGDRRQSAAERMQAALEEELHQLAMKHARLAVQIDSLAQPRETGFERVEFLFSPNPGEPPKALAKIASGGELSRIMLAMKQLHPESDVPTLIFDEVDTGIGGATSALVGKKLQTVATRQQVLCITHLPQVAAHADCHYKVEKHVTADRTTTTVTPLDHDERVEEIARMLGALVITDKSRAHARELLQHAAAC
jgi:DNA repair protein RecN (Recombination protein N)